MTVDDVKGYLQITDATFDASIALYLPLVSKDLELITNQRWVIANEGDLTITSDTITNTHTRRVNLGSMVTTPQYENSKVVSIDDEAESMQVSDAATATVTDARILANVFPEAKKHIAAQMVFYQIRVNATDAKLIQGYQSERFGNYNYTLDDGEGRTMHGYPMSLVKGLSDITFARFV
jgi:hypothetical protein